MVLELGSYLWCRPVAPSLCWCEFWTEARLCQPYLKSIVPQQHLPVVGDEVVEAVKYVGDSQKELEDVSVLPPMDAETLHLLITPHGQNVVPNIGLSLPDEEAAIRGLHLSTGLRQQPLGPLRPAPSLPWMQLHVGAHLLCAGRLPRLFTTGTTYIRFHVCSTWALYQALAMQMGSTSGKKNLADPEKNKSRRESAMGEKGKVIFEAGDALLALPFMSTTRMYLLCHFGGLPSLRGQ
ncbi:uncharacterized protein LOC116236867 [Phasianus colchicus]|uniref:uncharacterized protein LOC116236867 n=1 Tax=Phasianus colchicus TaxID=9054 RepID=UPI00129E4C27|nr:uncharacterized protein LOC116236867 [Phasianus colchicus]